ncbi:helix-turn-helix domain-containing protein [Streptomyces sp. NPDC006711]|uniref:helix-turn-helix domain-containing protein n=1 Tax=Streptomyces sp. NPDC006711 TaxID=3364762 RepID=UPI00367AFF7A
MTQSTAGTGESDATSPLPTPKERRRLREAKALSEAQVASAVGVTRATVRSWETGRTAPRGRRRAIYARLLATFEAETAPSPASKDAAVSRNDSPPHERPGTHRARPADPGAGHPGHPGQPEHTGQPDHQGHPGQPDQSDQSDQPGHPGGTGADRDEADGAGGRRGGASAGPDEGDTVQDGGPGGAQGSGERHAVAGRGQGASAGKPPAKPHAVNTRPKPAADGSAGKSSRPGGRTAKPSPAPQPAPAGAVSVPEPAKEASQSAALTGAGALSTGGVRTLPERPPDAEHDPGPAVPDEAEPGATPEARPAPAVPRPEPSPITGLTPAEAFDALYAATAPALAQQTYLLTGRIRLARESVQRAFHLAWENWPEVATDRDPAGWVRTAAYEYAMSPWHRFRRTHKHPDRPPVEPERRALLDALLALPPAYRRTVLLYDGLGLDLPETAAEIQASTPATANRVLNARAAIVERVPAVHHAKTPGALSAVLRDRITDLALAGPPALTVLPAARGVRVGGERRRRFWTRAAIAFTAMIVGATAFTVVTVPHYHVRPVPFGQRVGGVPVYAGPPRLSSEDVELRDKLRAEPARGPYRLVLDIR